MTVDFQLEPADVLAIAQERRRFEPVALSRLYYYGILPTLGVGLALVTQSLPTAAVFMVLFITSGWFIRERIQRAYRRTIFLEQNYTFRRWSATLTDEGVCFSSDAAEGLYRWPFIRRVFRSSRFVHIELTPLETVHIPIRAFRDEEQIQNFITKAQSHVKSPAT